MIALLCIALLWNYSSWCLCHVHNCASCFIATIYVICVISQMSSMWHWNSNENISLRPYLSHMPSVWNHDHLRWNSWTVTKGDHASIEFWYKCCQDKQTEGWLVIWGITFLLWAKLFILNVIHKWKLPFEPCVNPFILGHRCLEM